MATYTFETMSASDAANYTGADNLVFQTDAVGSLSVKDNPSVTTTGPLGTSTTVESITISDGTHTQTFAADQLHAASLTNHIIFLNGDSLVVGTNGDDQGSDLLAPQTDPGAGHGSVIYGFGGDDTIDVSNSTANDTVAGGEGDDWIIGGSHYTDANGNFTESDFLQGGNGGDHIFGGEGNDHIYGNMFSSTAGAADGDDSIAAGAGNDYVNGNAGNDTIAGDDGKDRLYGGNGDDNISGGNDADYLQGNKGNDILDGGNGHDTIHGGAGNDTLHGDLAGGNVADDLWGDAGNDSIVGANGADNIVGGADYDTMTGNGGNDTFWFAANDASDHNLHTASTAAGHDVTDVITDFTDGQDHLALGFTVSAVIHGQAGVTPATVDAAEAYAQTLLSASTGTHGTEVAAVTVGGDTYLFWDDTHSSATINSVLHLTGVADSVINSSGNNADFV